MQPSNGSSEFYLLSLPTMEATSLQPGENYRNFTTCSTNENPRIRESIPLVSQDRLDAIPSHFSGIWEAGVKQMKALLFKYLGIQRLTSEEFYTILTEVEAILNSRPLVSLDSAPVDGAQVLTPAHFLIGRSIKALPDQPDNRPNIKALRRWNLCTRLTHDIWDRWSQHYLHQLQQHHQWLHPKRSVQVGDVVLLKDTELFLYSGPLAVVKQMHPRTDGMVRVVTLRTSKGCYKRSVTRLVPLLQEDSQELWPREDVQV